MKKIIFIVLILMTAFLATPVLAYVPSDPMYPMQSYLKQINIEPAWDETKGEGVIVAVIDAGVDINHPDLQFNIWKNPDEIAGDGVDNDRNGFIDDVNGWDFLENVPNPEPKWGDSYDAEAVNHGTAIAGLIAAVANNSKGIAGVAFGAKIMPLRILGADGTGEVNTLIKALDYAVKNGADIVNLSLVGYDFSDDLLAAVRRASQAGVLIVAAAGNNSPTGYDLDNKPAYPVCYGNNLSDNLVLAVTAVGANGVKSKFANYGSNCIDLSAPGENITSLAYYKPSSGLTDYYSYGWNGTSFSAALVSGTAALIKSRESSLSPQEMISVLRQSADSLDDRNPQYAGELGAGLINVGRALSASAVWPQSGRLVKLANNAAVYYVEPSGIRHLFVNEVTYWSWYQGSWSDQSVETIDQDEFDGLTVGKNVSVRPGSNLIRFENSPRIFAVSFGGILRPLDEQTAASLYGADYQKKVVLIQDGFEADYVRGSALSVNELPEGSVFQYAGSSDIWYLENGKKRQIDETGFAANGFNTRYIIKGVNENLFYNSGKVISSLEKNIFTYSL